MIGVAIAILYFYALGFKLEVLSIMIKKTPTPLGFIWGHGPKCICLSIWLFIVCLLLASIVKSIIYRIIGMIYGMTPTSALDDFWMYDYPVNRINVPGCIIFNKPKDRTPEQMLKHLIKNVNVHTRTRGRMVKKFGKFFIEAIPEGSKEYENWIKECTAILWDVKTDQDVLDLFCKLKKVALKDKESAGAIKFFYIPDLNKTESAFLTVGHHCNHDGISQF